MEAPRSAPVPGTPLQENDLRTLEVGALLLLITPLTRIIEGQEVEIEPGEVFLVSAQPMIIVRDRLGRQFHAPRETLHCYPRIAA